MSRFAKFFETATPSGKKVMGSIHPEIKAASTKDKFVLNDVARKLLGLKTGDRVLLYDMAGQDGVDSMNNRFFVSKGGVDANGTIHGAIMAKNGVFSYSEIWSAYQMQDMAVVAARPDDMVAAGIIIKTEEGLDENGKKTGGNYIAKQLILGKLSIGIEDGEEMRGVEVQKGLFVDIYAVSDLRVVPHDPRVSEDDDEPGENPALTKGKRGKRE